MTLTPKGPDHDESFRNVGEKSAASRQARYIALRSLSVGLVNFSG